MLTASLFLIEEHKLPKCLHCFIFFMIQVTQLKIRYNPFAKAFQDGRERGPNEAANNNILTPVANSYLANGPIHHPTSSSSSVPQYMTQLKMSPLGQSEEADQQMTGSHHGSPEISPDPGNGTGQDGYLPQTILYPDTINSALIRSSPHHQPYTNRIRSSRRSAYHLHHPYGYPQSGHHATAHHLSYQTADYAQNTYSYYHQLHNPNEIDGQQQMAASSLIDLNPNPPQHQHLHLPLQHQQHSPSQSSEQHLVPLDIHHHQQQQLHLHPHVAGSNIISSSSTPSSSSPSTSGSSSVSYCKS